MRQPNCPTIFPYTTLFRSRDKAVDRQQVALDNRLWPEDTVKVSNNIANQFEAPVLFYALCLAFLGLNAVSAVALFLASLFVLSRYLHAWVHTDRKSTRLNSSHVRISYA